MAKITYEDEHTEKIWKRMSNFSGAKKDVKYVRYNGGLISNKQIFKPNFYRIKPTVLIELTNKKYFILL